MEHSPGNAVDDGRPGPQTRPAGRGASFVVLVAVVAAVALVVPTVVAAVSSLQFGRTEITVQASPLAVWTFDGAPVGGWAAPEAFDAGAQSGLTVSAAGLTSAPVGSGALDGVAQPGPDAEAWWDEAWGVRLCDDLAHDEAGASSIDGWSHPVALDTATLVDAGLARADLADLRAVVDGTERALWVDTTADVVWVTVPTLAASASTSICLYAANPAATPPAEELRGADDVFGPDAGRTVDLVALDPDLDGTRSVSLAATFAGTAVAVTPTTADPGGVALTLDDADVATVSGIELGTIVRADGPLSSRVEGVGADTLVPVSWATLDAVLPLDVGGLRLAIAAPFGAATVTLSRGSTTLATVSVGDGSGRTTSMPVTVWTDPGSGADGAPLRVTADRPVLVGLDSADGFSVAVAPPTTATDPAQWGVSPATLVASAPGSASVDLVADSAAGNSSTVTASSGSITDASAGSADQTGIRVALAPDAPAAATATAWTADGGEAAPVLPSRELASRYVLPADADALLIVCPDPSLALTLTEPDSSTRAILCEGATGSTVGDAVVAGAPAGTIVASDDGRTFVLTSGDLSSVLGFTQARPGAWPLPSTTRRIEGLLPTTATWTAPPITTDGGVVGALRFTAELPVTDLGVTSVVVRVGDGPGQAVVSASPTPEEVDAALAGTGIVEVDVVTALPAELDGMTQLPVTVELLTEDRSVAPTIGSLTISHDLPSSSAVPGEAITSSVAVGPLLRLASGPSIASGSTLSVVDAGGGDAGATFATGGAPSAGPVAFDPGSTIVLDGSPGSGPRSLDVFLDHGGTGVRTHLRLEVSP